MSMTLTHIPKARQWSLRQPPAEPYPCWACSGYRRPFWTWRARTRSAPWRHRAVPARSWPWNKILWLKIRSLSPHNNPSLIPLPHQCVVLGPDVRGHRLDHVRRRNLRPVVRAEFLPRGRMVSSYMKTMSDWLFERRTGAFWVLLLLLLLLPSLKRGWWTRRPGTVRCRGVQQYGRLWWTWGRPFEWGLGSTNGGQDTYADEEDCGGRKTEKKTGRTWNKDSVSDITQESKLLQSGLI